MLVYHLVFGTAEIVDILCKQSVLFCTFQLAAYSIVHAHEGGSLAFNFYAKLFLTTYNKCLSSLAGFVCVGYYTHTTHFTCTCACVCACNCGRSLMDD